MLSQNNTRLVIYKIIINLHIFALNHHAGLCKLRNLQELDLRRNDFVGSPNHCLANLTSLRALDLSYNQFEGSFDTSFIAGLTSLEYLSLSHNRFQGILDLSNNNLSGQILEHLIMGCSSLEFLKLSYNNLYGKYLDLSENDIQGSIPSCFSPQNLEHVHLQKNRLEGPMTNAFSNSTSLVTLDIRDNHLNGRIPEWIGGLSSLNTLLFKGNQFEGQIPVQFCQLKNLNIMDFSLNSLLGAIPFCLNNITFKGEPNSNRRNSEVELATLGYDELYSYKSIHHGGSRSGVHNKIPVRNLQGVVLELMSGIDLSCNKLVGNIPPEIGDLSDILALNLSHNYLNGQIPPSISNLTKIESLDLSYNNLTGMIPPHMIELNSLSNFNVAHNNLSGRTPERKGQFATFGESSYEGNPLLCGEPLKKNNCTNSSKAPPSMQTAPGDMDMDSFVVCFIASYITVLLGLVAVFYINPYWRRVWFYLIDVCVTSTYYFVIDNIHKLLSFSY
uniref:Uncharacterized protein n=1 Tax=Nelumbo nucifera TaxID=4432 RepID=A0A822YCN4_NELNU|nr:TPA_asm: hypothetical protein HUJ06_031695 [Nelumbo nucifera]